MPGGCPPVMFSSDVKVRGFVFAGAESNRCPTLYYSRAARGAALSGNLCQVVRILIRCARLTL